MPPTPPLSGPRQALCLAGSVLSFHLAGVAPQMAGLFVLGFVALLLQLRRAPTARVAFYLGLLAGIGVMAPPLFFFCTIFSFAGPGLWVLLAIWTGAFTSMVHVIEKRWGRKWLTVLAPVLWIGLEFARCEVWPLRFAWLTPAFQLPADVWSRAFHWLGVYGLGGIFVLTASLCHGKRRWILALALPVLAWPLGIFRQSSEPVTTAAVEVTGVQWERAPAQKVMASLEEARAKHPETQLFVLSEYTFSSPPPPEALAWCRSHGCHLIAGGIELLPGASDFNAFHNTAFIVGTDGAIAHRQVKAVPIQLMSDGQPAAEQRVWDSSFGRIGFGVCYDMSYIRVMDRLVSDGAQGLIIPAMDVENWGVRAHRLSAQLGAVRAAEYGLPLFRLASSGVSQVIQAGGAIDAESSVPGQGEIIHGTLRLPEKGHLPLDRLIVWPCFGIAALTLAALLCGIGKRRRPQASHHAD